MLLRKLLVAAGLLTTLVQPLQADTLARELGLGVAGPLDLAPPRRPCFKSYETRIEDCLEALLPKRERATPLVRGVDRAVVAAHLDDYDLAKRELDRAFASGKPSVAQLHFSSRLHLSLAPRARDALSRAQRDIDEALKLEPRNADLWATKSQVSARMQLTDAALTQLDRAIDLAPDHTFARAQRAELLLRAGREQQAEADFDHLLRIEPDNTFAYMRRANIRFASGRLEEAERDVDRVIPKLRPRETDPYFFRAEIRAGRGDLQGAIADLTTVIERIGDAVFPPTRAKLARALLSRGTLLRETRQAEAALADVMNAIGLGAAELVMRVQVMLVGQGAELEVGAAVTEPMRRAVARCMADEECAGELTETILFIPDR